MIEEKVFPLLADITSILHNKKLIHDVFNTKQISQMNKLLNVADCSAKCELCPVWFVTWTLLLSLSSGIREPTALHM